MKLKSFMAGVMLLALSVTASADAGYTTDQLCRMALDYYEATSPYHHRPAFCEAQVNRDDSVTLHLYDIVQDGSEYAHTATADWYYVDPLTGKGTNLLNQEVDLSPYATGGSQGVAEAAGRPGVAEAAGRAESMTPFYGVWCSASKTYADIQQEAQELSAEGFRARVYVSTDWNNLNQEFWYVMSAGAYSTEEAARAALPHVQKYYPDAYVKYTGAYKGEICPDDGRDSAEIETNAQTPFYGIWCQAAKSLSEAQGYANELSAQGIWSTVFVTTDWSNLNPEMWYVVSAGVYGSEEQAQARLPEVQRVYPEAYVKYSGEHR